MLIAFSIILTKFVSLIWKIKHSKDYGTTKIEHGKDKIEYSIILSFSKQD